MTFEVFRGLEDLDMAMNLLHYRKMCILFLIVMGNLDMKNHKKKKIDKSIILPYRLWVL